MNIAILSGKGGVGKTFVSVNLAVTAGEAWYLDCDVEAPNGGLFLNAAGDLPVSQTPVSVLVPAVNNELCTGCRACADLCAFNALAFIGTPLLFEEMCHSCGGCALVCPSGAITEKPREMGTVERFERSGLHCLGGRMNIGESTGIPIIREMLAAPRSGLTVVDCPPGTACPAAECVKEADYCLIVAEPSVYGTHNLRMAHDLVKFFGKPCGAVVNKVVETPNLAEDYCSEAGLPVLARIPFSKELAGRIAEAQVVVEHDPELRALFADLLERIKKEAAR